MLWKISSGHKIMQYAQTISSECLLIHSTITIQHLSCSRHKAEVVLEALEFTNQWEINRYSIVGGRWES